ncbi:MAG: deoxyribose-phosphate aldolase [Chloroflexi bacterium HGW-Chloroflexi-8]|nr:MAG: deoxyribose-phosphate aldolase [Chloroflexi bacterium HGW-Chloroflexi-8]
MIRFDPKTITYEQLAKVIDHSLLKPELTEAEVLAGCELAAQYHVATVCVKPCHVTLAKEALKDSDVLVSTVIGFPHGSNRTPIKVAEARLAMDEGAVELDMVLNIGELRSGKVDLVREDIKAVVDVAHARGVKVKVILENAYLTDQEKVTACRLAEAAGADWVKTSTGFAPSGATLEDLRLMRSSVSEHVQVKSAGGVRTLDALLGVIEAGVTRSGATTTKQMLDEFKQRQIDEKTDKSKLNLNGGN